MLILSSEHHLRLVADRLIEFGHMPPGSQNIAVVMLQGQPTMAAAIPAVQDVYGWTPDPDVDPWPSDSAPLYGCWRSERRAERERRRQVELGRALYPSGSAPTRPFRLL